MTFALAVHALSLLLILSSALALRFRGRDQSLSLSLLRSLFALPLLLTQYLYLAYDMNPRTADAVLFTEVVFVLTWGFLAYRLGKITVSTDNESMLLAALEPASGVALYAASIFFLVPGQLHHASNGCLVIGHNSLPYFFTLLMLFSMLTMAWRLEVFWRSLEPMRRWEYKFLVVAGYLVSCSLIWSASYRLTYLQLWGDHFLFLSALLSVAWLMMFYAVGRHRLLNRKLFVSRKIIYSSFAPFAFGVYLIAVGFVSLLMRMFGWPLSFVLFWFMVAMGLIAVGLYIVSEKLRRHVHFFISTHFYINKYEYRDEWLLVSHLLRNAFTENEIVRAVAQVLTDSLYTGTLMIWLGSESMGFRLRFPGSRGAVSNEALDIAGNNSIVQCVNENGYFYAEDMREGGTCLEAVEKNREFLEQTGVVLVAPISVSGQILGLVGLGREYTGGRYGQDDFDLLAAIGAQAASSLLFVRMADELASMKQSDTLHALSAFVLHDIKNAASMLSLVKQNAKDHMQDPEFQEDLLEAIDNALRRMAKVQEQLSELRGERAVDYRELDLCNFLRGWIEKTARMLPSVRITLQCRCPVIIRMDSSLLSKIMENLILNAYEAGGEGTTVGVTVGCEGEQRVAIELVDDGPGIPAELLPNKIFDIFQSTKTMGTGIGLWQVKRLTECLQGRITAGNTDEGGARFLVSFPLKTCAESSAGSGSLVGGG